MLQKFATGFAAAAALAAIAGCVILWIAVDSGREAVAKALEEQRLDREQNAKANAALLARLEKLAADRKKPARTMEWNPLKFKLLLGDKGDQPAVGYMVSIQGAPYGPKQSVQKTSNKDGIVDFGVVRPGAYSVYMSTPWHFSNSLHISVAPGEERTVTVRCPRKAVVNAKVQVKIDLPKDLLDRNIAVMIERYSPQQTAGNFSWSRSSSWSGFVGDGRTEANAILDWNRESVPLRNVRPLLGMATHAETAQKYLKDGSIYRRGPSTPPEWKTADYRISQLAVLLPGESLAYSSPRFSRGKTTWGIIGETRFYENNKYVGPTFEPIAGKDNVWTVALPDKLLKEVRERLRELDAQKKQISKRKSEFEQLAKGNTPTGTDFDKLTEDERGSYIGIARRYFSYMDSTGNRDRKLQKSEWSSSRRIRPIFEKAKLDLSKEMGEYDFVLHYIRLIGTEDPTWKNRGQKPTGSRRTGRLRP